MTHRDTGYSSKLRMSGNYDTHSNKHYRNKVIGNKYRVQPKMRNVEKLKSKYEAKKGRRGES